MQRTTRGLFAGLILLFAGCYRPPAAELPAVPPDTRGIVTRAPMANNRNRMLVDALPGARAGGTFEVKVFPQSRVLQSVNGQVRGVLAATLVEGAVVEVWFDGPVRETNPAKGTAATVHIVQGAEVER